MFPLFPMFPCLSLAIVIKGAICLIAASSAMVSLSNKRFKFKAITLPGGGRGPKPFLEDNNGPMSNIPTFKRFGSFSQVGHNQQGFKNDDSIASLIDTNWVCFSSKKEE